MESLTTLVKNLGHHTARTIIESQIVYPRTASIQTDSAMFTGEFGNSLLEAIKQIQNDIELKAVDAVKDDAVVVLSMMEEFKDSLLISKADFVVVYKGGFDVVKLININRPNSGRSIYVEINSCRNELIRIIQTARGKDTPWLEVGIAVGVALLVAFQLVRK